MNSIAPPYRYVIVEVISAPYENSRRKIRARPLPGQWASTALRMECPTSIRKPHNIGQLYKVRAKLKDTTTAPQLFTSYHWTPDLVTAEEAAQFIKIKNWW